ncbi:MAG: HK97 gp10 family phage protein [Thermodesulfobacteriota bacterium]
MAVRNGSVRIGGQRSVIRNLRKAIAQIEGATAEGLREAALLVKNRAVKITPVDTGNLRNSAYVEMGEVGPKTVAEIGYTASYAPFVHEINKRYRAPGTGWKFLETALKQSVADILAIIKKRARVK